MAEQQQPNTPANRRLMPQSELDFNMLTTNPVWGTSEVPAELKTLLNKKYATQDNKVYIQSLWANMGFFTRDLRMGNLSSGGKFGEEENELKYCQYFTDLAYDLLDEGYPEAFLIALERSATLLELSHSKGGFFRTLLNTIRQESTHQELAPPKKGLFGVSKQGGQ